jgi:hypothetical protein
LSDHKASVVLASAALMEIISRSQALQAAVIRQATQAELEAIRSGAHDVLDAYLDHSAAAATKARAILGD